MFRLVAYSPSLEATAIANIPVARKDRGPFDLVCNALVEVVNIAFRLAWVCRGKWLEAAGCPVVACWPLEGNLDPEADGFA